jgi:hypothetical protein
MYQEVEDATWNCICGAQCDSQWQCDCYKKANDKLKKDSARLARYDDLLSAEMPPDFKDWHENSREEWPEIAALVIRNLRERLDEAEK